MPKLQLNVLPTQTDKAAMKEMVSIAKLLQLQSHKWLHPKNNEKLSEIILELEWLEHLSKREV